MKRYAVLLYAALGLAATLAAGCADGDGSDAYSRFLGLPTDSEYLTMRMLQEEYHACLAKGEAGDVCRRDLLAYRACMDSGKKDAHCRAELFR